MGWTQTQPSTPRMVFCSWAVLYLTAWNTGNKTPSGSHARMSSSCSTHLLNTARRYFPSPHASLDSTRKNPIFWGWASLQELLNKIARFCSTDRAGLLFLGTATSLHDEGGQDETGAHFPPMEACFVRVNMCKTCAKSCLSLSKLKTAHVTAFFHVWPCLDLGPKWASTSKATWQRDNLLNVYDLINMNSYL